MYKPMKQSPDILPEIREKVQREISKVKIELTLCSGTYKNAKRGYISQPEIFQAIWDAPILAEFGEPIGELKQRKEIKLVRNYYRTITEACKELKRLDPQTPFTKYFISELVKTDAVYTVKSGKKTLISMESLYNYLQINPEEKVENDKEENNDR